MASPVDSARQGTNVATAAGTWAINVGSPVAGTLLIVFIHANGAAGGETFTGYNLLGGPSNLSGIGDNQRVYWRLADGTEGATDTWDPVNSIKGAAICWEITGAADPTITPPEISSHATAASTSANVCNPASRAVTGGPKDVLYLAMGGVDDESGAFTGAPTNYTNLIAANSGTGGTADTNCLIGGASRQVAASSSDDPGVFTHAGAITSWGAFTVVVHPAQVSGRAIGKRKTAHRYLILR